MTLVPVSIRIPLTGGLHAVIDPEDYELVSRYNWHPKVAEKHKFQWYAYTRIPSAERYSNGKFKRKHILMHTLISGYERTDHVNGDGLDNRKTNLRAATAMQNARNRPKYKGGTSRYKGVNLVRHSGNWRASITVDKKYISLGCYAIEEDAARTYDEAALRYFGEFALTNEMLGLLEKER